MDRRQFLACSAAAAVLPAAPVSAAPSVGVDLAAGADRSAIIFFETTAGAINSWSYHVFSVDDGTINVLAWGEALDKTGYYPDEELTLISNIAIIGP